jgi:acetoin utilization deacetylase AcuC-like enzyme
VRAGSFFIRLRFGCPTLANWTQKAKPEFSLALKIRVHSCAFVVESRRVKIITDERCTGYSSHGHPERPARVAMTLARLRQQKEIPIEWITPGTVEDALLLRAHTPEHLARLRIHRDFDGDTPYYEGIESYARSAVAAALAALKAARAGEVAFSLMRPPGHHATQNQAMGFCFLNSVAIAALHALATGTKRIAVYDFDVHHGNGTEAILLDKSGAAYFSVHQHPCYPGTGTANVGTNCFNYPVAPHTPRGEYRKVLARALGELKNFKPELIAVSAGFDAYTHDPLAQETLEAEDFHWLGRELRQTGVPMFSLLEGGYSDELPELVFAYLKGINGK